MHREAAFPSNWGCGVPLRPAYGILRVSCAILSVLDAKLYDKVQVHVTIYV